MARLARHYENAVIAVLFSSEEEKAISEASLAICNLAAEIDSVERRIVEAAERSARLLEEYAAALKDGKLRSFPLSGCREIEEAVSRLEEKRDRLSLLVRVVHGAEKVKAIWSAVAASKAAAT